MPTKEPILSVAEVCELQPGDANNATWINPGFTAVVLDIKSTKTKKTGQPMHICTLGGTNEVGEISMTLFGACRIKEGDTIEVSGKGLRRSEFNGLAQVSVGKETEVHVIGAHVQADKPAAQPTNQGTKAASEPAKQHSKGQTVGMAMKEAIALELETNGLRVGLASDPFFWAAVHRNASAIIRLSNALERGNLTPPLSAKAAPLTKEAPVPSGGRADPPPGNKRPPAGLDGAVALDAGDEEGPF